MEDASQVKTIDRLVQVLDCFSVARPTWTLAELSTHLHLPKSTLHRFLTGLESHGILRRDSGDKKWRLGYHLYIWGQVAAESTTLRELAKPILCRLVADSGETAILTVYHDGVVTCVDKCETSHPVRLQMEVGQQRAAHAGASSKVLMAYLSPEEIQAVVRERGLPRVGLNTITDLAALELELARIREQGYARSVEETDAGAWGVATPILDWRGQVVGAVGLAGPTMRYGEEQVDTLVMLCRRAATELSSLLAQGPQPQATSGSPGETVTETGGLPQKQSAVRER